MLTSPYLTDAEVDDICAGLVQSAAKVKFLQGLGLTVARKPNGRPLVRRPAELQPPGGAGAQNAPGSGFNIVALQQWANTRKQQGQGHGKKA